MSRFLNGRLRDLTAYVPGEQPQDGKYIKLNTNESPFPPTPRAAERITAAEVDKLRLYCDPEAGALAAAIARGRGLKRENVLMANGSDEILAFCFAAFCGERGLCFPDITYGFYKVTAALMGLPCEEIPLREDFAVNADDYFNKGKTVVLANPNAQTGLYLEREQIERIIAANRDSVVIVDEAYIDFGGESCCALIDKYDNLVVVQTFSKSRSLAGGRIGFAAAQPQLIADLNRVKYSFNPYNVNRLSALAAQAAEEDTEYFDRCRGEIIKTRERTKHSLEALGFTVLDSKANFLLIGQRSIKGEDLYLRLKERGVLVRHFKQKRIEDYIRITVGTNEQTDILINVITEILREVQNA